MRTAVITAVLAAMLLSLVGCGQGGSETKSVIPGETSSGPPPISQPAKAP